WIVLVVLAAGCSNTDSGTASDLSAPLDMGPPVDAAGQFGATCDFVKKNCFSGLHCATTAVGDVCIPDPAAPIPEGGACTAINFGGIQGDFCTPGTSCIDYEGTSLCRRGCFVHADCADGDYCVAPTNSATTKKIMGQDTPLSACVTDEGCDPVAQTGCAAGACYFGGGDDVGRPRVCQAKSGTQPPDTTCMSHNDCAPGETCSGLGFCRLLCYVVPVTDADAGTTLGACPDGEGSCGAFFGSAGVFGLCE
ncbi:MAG TPA: hypothetical protein VFF06_34380, partial [Polyangia bacterium]|nr:hypothetical protein [Polyangia bacterium]